MGQHSSSRWPAGSAQGAALGLASGYLALFPAPWVELFKEVVVKVGAPFLTLVTVGVVLEGAGDPRHTWSARKRHYAHERTQERLKMQSPQLLK